MIDRLIDYSERGLIPDSLIRLGIRRLLRKRLQQVDQGSEQANLAQTDLLVERFSAGPIALLPEMANQQHYEVPQELFELTLGPRLKYSSCFFPESEQAGDPLQKIHWTLFFYLSLDPADNSQDNL